MGMSLPGSSAQDAVSDSKIADCRAAGAAVLNLLEKDIKPSDIMTREAFENAITVVIALGGSTNAVLHLLAMAHTANVQDRKSTRLNSSHVAISYAVFCLKK